MKRHDSDKVINNPVNHESTVSSQTEHVNSNTSFNSMDFSESGTNDDAVLKERNLMPNTFLPLENTCIDLNIDSGNGSNVTSGYFSSDNTSIAPVSDISDQTQNINIETLHTYKDTFVSKENMSSSHSLELPTFKSKTMSSPVDIVKDDTDKINQSDISKFNASNNNKNKSAWRNDLESEGEQINITQCNFDEIPLAKLNTPTIKETILKTPDDITEKVQETEDVFDFHSESDKNIECKQESNSRTTRNATQGRVTRANKKKQGEVLLYIFCIYLSLYWIFL